MSARPDYFHKMDAARSRIEEALGQQHRDEAMLDGVKLVRASTLKPEPIKWLWPEWLALGKMHILAGAPGQGKTTLALAFAATVTCGGRWPDGKRCPPGNVLVWSGEDDPKDTLLPRLLTMGADPQCVFFVDGARVNGESVAFDPSRDMQALAEAAKNVGGCALLIVDPVVSAVNGDSHKNTEVRRALQPLVDLGAMLGCAVVGISHFSKGGAGRDPTERVVGSVAFGAVARVVMVAAKVKTDDGTARRVLARSKSNIGPDSGGFDYAIEQAELDAHPGVFASGIAWGSAVEGTARDLLAEPDAEDQVDADEPAHGVDEFLLELLKGGLPASSKDIKAAAREMDYAWRTVHRAAKRVGVKITKNGMTGGWYWTLPKMPNRPEGAERASVSDEASSAPSTPSVASSTDAEVI